MCADGSEYFGMGFTEYHRHGCARREPRDEYPRGIDAVVQRYLARDARDDRRLSTTGLLIFGAKPVPALRAVRLRGLRRISDEEPVGVCQFVHARARGKV